jgi:hypothetical protein
LHGSSTRLSVIGATATGLPSSHPLRPAACVIECPYQIHNIRPAEPCPSGRNSGRNSVSSSPLLTVSAWRLHEITRDHLGPRASTRLAHAPIFGLTSPSSPLLSPPRYFVFSDGLPPGFGQQARRLQARMVLLLWFPTLTFYLLICA